MDISFLLHYSDGVSMTEELGFEEVRRYQRRSWIPTRLSCQAASQGSHAGSLGNSECLSLPTVFANICIGLIPRNSANLRADHHEPNQLCVAIATSCCGLHPPCDLSFFLRDNAQVE